MSLVKKSKTHFSARWLTWICFLSFSWPDFNQARCETHKKAKRQKGRESRFCGVVFWGIVLISLCLLHIKSKGPVTSDFLMCIKKRKLVVIKTTRNTAENANRNRKPVKISGNNVISTCEFGPPRWFWLLFAGLSHKFRFIAFICQLCGGQRLAEVSIWFPEWRLNYKCGRISK